MIVVRLPVQRGNPLRDGRVGICGNGEHATWLVMFWTTKFASQLRQISGRPNMTTDPIMRLTLIMAHLHRAAMFQFLRDWRAARPLSCRSRRVSMTPNNLPACIILSGFAKGMSTWSSLILHIMPGCVKGNRKEGQREVGRHHSPCVKKLTKFV